MDDRDIIARRRMEAKERERMNRDFSAYAMQCSRCNKFHALLSSKADPNDVVEFVTDAINRGYKVVRVSEEDIKQSFGVCPLPKPIITVDNYNEYVQG